MTAGGSGSSAWRATATGRALCRAVGRRRLADRSALRRPVRPRRQRDRLIAELDEIFATKPLDEWAEIFAGEPDFFWSPINSLDDVVADEQFHAAGGIVYVPDGDASVADGGHARRLPRHAVGAALGRAAARRAHRRDPRRTQGSVGCFDARGGVPS